MVNGRVQIIIDGNNLDMCSPPQWRMNLNKFVSHVFGLFGPIAEPRLYYSSFTGESNSLSMTLRNMGIKVIYETPKTSRRWGKTTTHADVDWSIISDVYELYLDDKFDTLVFVSGDGDFYRMLKSLSLRGIRVIIMSFKESTNHRLKEFEFVDLNTLLRVLKLETTGQGRNNILEHFAP